MADFSVHALFFYFCLYLSSCTHCLPRMLIQHSYYSDNLPLHLGLFHPNFYPHVTPEL